MLSNVLPLNKLFLRSNGGVIGKRNVPTTSLASGLWGLVEQSLSKLGSIWPILFTGTTWNPADKSASITLSNGNLTAADTTADKGVRSISSKSSGKWYVEMTQESASTTNTLIGIAKSTAALDFPGADANGWGYYSNNGNKFNSGSGSAYGASYTTSDIVMIAYDADNGKLWFGKNGTWQASGDPAAGTNAAYTGLSGAMFLMWGTSTASVAQQTMNFGASTFAYTPPTGFTGWSA